MSLRKILFIVLALVILMPATSHATISRVIGMGGAETNWIIKDAYNSAIWPQLVKNYGSQAGAEFYTGNQGWDFQKAYVNYEFGDEASALQFAIDKTNTRTFGDDTALAPLDAIPGGYNKLNITYGRPIGEDMLIGVALNYGGKSYTEEPGGTDNSYSQMGLSFGLTAMENKLDAALAFETASWEIGSDAGVAAEGDGASSIGLAARYWHELNDNYKIIPTLGFATHTDNTKVPAGSNEYSETMIKVGCGNNWTPKENLLVITDFGLHMNNATMTPAGGTEATADEMDLYWRVGVESKIFEWLNGRFGAERAWEGTAYDFGGGAEETIGAPVSATYLGATVHWNRLVLDTIVNPDFLGWGPNFVSGYTDMLVWRTSMKINFDKE
ncbi:hypothetical protein IT157_04155 [bacterium]|nr:hypothetical protein [bacterium]